MPAKNRKTSRIKNTSARKVRPVRKKSSLSSRSIKKKKKVKKYATLVILALFSLVFLGGVLVFNFLDQHLALADNPTGVSVKDELFPSFIYGVVENIDNNINYLTKLQLVLIDRKSSKEYIYDVPVDMEYDIPGKFSNEQIKKVLAIGSLDNNDEKSKELLLNLVQKLFGFKSTKYILVDNKYESVFDSYVKNGSYLALINRELLEEFDQKVDTNLTLKEFYNLGSIVSEIPYDRVTVKTYFDTYIKNSDLLDKEIQEFTITSPLNDEKLSIAVLNGTDKAGIAYLGARVIRNLGGRIVIIGNTLEPSQESIIVTDNVSSETVNIISDVLNIGDIRKKQDLPDFVNPDESDRSDVIVILGFDILGKM